MYCSMNAMRCHHHATPCVTAVVELALDSITSITIDDHQVGPSQASERKGDAFELWKNRIATHADSWYTGNGASPNASPIRLSDC